jgi:hypothetical protein
MTKRIVLACAWLLVVGLAAQKRPDFTGTWIVSVPAKSAGKEFVVKHDGKSLQTTMGRRPVTYILDGSEQLSQVPMSGDIIRISTRAGWENDRIVIIENTAYPTGMKTMVRETWSLDATGRLVIDTVETMAGLPNKPDIQQRVFIRKK